MKLIVAGASHGVPEKHRFCTSLFLQAGENTYIIDAGAPISALLDHYDIPHKTVKGYLSRIAIPIISTACRNFAPR